MNVKEPIIFLLINMEQCSNSHRCETIEKGTHVVIMEMSEWSQHLSPIEYLCPIRDGAAVIQR